LRAPEAGELRIDTDRGVDATLRVDGIAAGLSRAIAAGVHIVTIDGTLRGTQWRLVPTWNGRDLWPERLATIKRPTAPDVFVRRALAWVPTVAVLALMLAWTASALARIRGATVFAWSAIASAVIVWLVEADRVDAARWAVVALAAGALVPVPRRLRNITGAF